MNTYTWIVLLVILIAISYSSGYKVGYWRYGKKPSQFPYTLEATSDNNKWYGLCHINTQYVPMKITKRKIAIF